MASLRDRLARFIPASIIYHEEVQEGFSRLASEAGNPPKNKNEAKAYLELTETCGFAVLNKGWPDFLVLQNEDDFFLVEVKGPGDWVKPQQRVVMEMLASKGINVYIRREEPYGAAYEPVGNSDPVKAGQLDIMAKEHLRV